MTDVFKIADILVSHAVRVHGNEIALIVYHGSYASGTATSTSDLDIYYVPDDGKAESLSTTFVIGDLPYEFDVHAMEGFGEHCQCKVKKPLGSVSFPDCGCEGALLPFGRGPGAL